jgi:hypothetical protein
MNVKSQTPSTTINRSALLPAASRRYVGLNDDGIDQDALSELNDDIILGLPWLPQEGFEIQKLLEKRTNTKIKFFVGAVVLLCLFLLSIPVMIYAVENMENYDWAIRICSILGSLDAFFFIVIVGFGYYFKYLDYELQVRVVKKMKELGITDVARYVAMGGDDNSRIVI